MTSATNMFIKNGCRDDVTEIQQNLRETTLHNTEPRQFATGYYTICSLKPAAMTPTVNPASEA